MHDGMCMETKIDSTTGWGPAPCVRVGGQDSGSASIVASMNAERERARTSLRHYSGERLCSADGGQSAELVKFSVSKQGSAYMKSIGIQREAYSAAR